MPTKVKAMVNRHALMEMTRLPANFLEVDGLLMMYFKTTSVVEM